MMVLAVYVIDQVVYIYEKAFFQVSVLAFQSQSLKIVCIVGTRGNSFSVVLYHITVQCDII